MPTDTGSPSPAANPVTVVVATIQGWPTVKAAILGHLAAAEAAGGTLVVADGSGKLPPPPGELGTAALWLSWPGLSVYQLRERAYAHATGEVVAVTEDHCFVPPDWAVRMVRSHREHPGAAAIGGSLENGTVRGPLDWASFLIIQSRLAAPIQSGPASRVAGAGNVSYKRAALRRPEPGGSLGANDLIDQDELVRAGSLLVADDSIRVTHDQSLGLAAMTALHFHSARTTAGFWRERREPADFARVSAAFVMPLPRFAAIARRLAGRGYLRQLFASAPAMVYLLYVQAAGMFLGYARGPGGSPGRVL